VKSEERWQQEDYALSHIRLRQVGRLVQSLGPRTVVDLGCHNGQLARLLPDVDYVGVDFVQHGEPSFPFFRCNFNETGLPDDLPSADVVVASGILEYIEDLPGFLRSVRAHVNPGGAFVATYFNMNHVSRLIGLMLGRSFDVHPDWRGFHSPLDFRRHLDEAGFVVERRVPTISSVRAPVELRQTVDQPVVLHDMRPWSLWLAQQLIYVARPSAARLEAETGSRHNLHSM
jgi:SAM-dependent methyltransferase